MLSFEEQLARAQSRLDTVHSKLDKLRAIRPSLIDLSLRENAVGARIGQTLADKLEVLPKLREFGFRDIVLGTLNYAFPDEPQVDDDFMVYLRDHQIDMDGCFALTDVGITGPDGTFTPSPSLLKLRDYRVPNTLHEIYLSDEGMAAQYDAATLEKSLPASVDWIRRNVAGDHGKPPRIIINIVDGCDAFSENLARTCSILRILAGLPIDGVSIEDGRGTFFPFQVGEFVAIAHEILPRHMQLLVHVHAGAGFENASVIEALLNGADGVWAGLPKRTAVNGHASLAELIANLVRIGNPSMNEYQLESMLPLASEIQERMDGKPVPDDLPILGANAYRLPLTAFRQRNDRFLDLPPERIGGSYRYRICPVVSDPAVIAGRLAEITGDAIDSFPLQQLELMVRLMRQDLRAGRRIAYDEPGQLLALYARARPHAAAAP
jgi:isopropylmalate/homocitrate/citramalate synthase